MSVSDKRPIVDRRQALTAAGMFASAALLPHPTAFAATLPGLASAAPTLSRARYFLSALDDGQRQAASFSWGGQQWRDWNYFGFPSVIKPGLRLEQMSDGQKAAAWDLAATILSPAGLTKARNVMTLQDVLAERGDGQRSSAKFSFAVFGTPAETGEWGFRLEGHHLTLSVAVADNQIVSVTPSSFSANPNRVTSGRHAGLVTLQAEEGLARRIFTDFTPKLAARARVSAKPLDNILSDAGNELKNRRKAGIPAADMSPIQRNLLWELVETYAVDHLVPALADAQRARVRTGDAAAAHFAWYGPNTAERALGYRLIGDAFVIELGSVDPAAQHLHTIYHDTGNVLGRRA